MHVHESRLLAAAQLALVIMIIFCRRMSGTHVKRKQTWWFLAEMTMSTPHQLSNK